MAETDGLRFVGLGSMPFAVCNFVVAVFGALGFTELAAKLD